MITRCAYYFKLFAIVVISSLLLSSVESAPEHPILFGSVLVFSLIINRTLWRSTQKVERKMKKEMIKNQQRATPKDGTARIKKKAA